VLGHAPRFEYLQEFRSQAGFDLVSAHLDDHAQRLHRDWKRTRGGWKTPCCRREKLLGHDGTYPSTRTYQIRARCSGATNILSPDCTLNASYQASMFLVGPSTRNCRGECGSLTTCFRT